MEEEQNLALVALHSVFDPCLGFEGHNPSFAPNQSNMFPLRWPSFAPSIVTVILVTAQARGSY